MKNFLLICALLVLVFGLGVAAFGQQAPDPKLDGKDVLVPQEVINAIPGFNPNKPVYAACEGNGWFLSGNASASSKEESQMIKEGPYWRARNMNCVRFHPVQLSGNNTSIWAKLESAYNLDTRPPFIDWSSGKPCLKVCR